jgi:hypothetical protein
MYVKNLGLSRKEGSLAAWPPSRIISVSGWVSADAEELVESEMCWYFSRNVIFSAYAERGQYNERSRGSCW